MARQSRTAPTSQGFGTSLLTFPSVVGSTLRRLRIELPLVSTVVGVALITSLIFAAAPRLFNHMSEDGLRYSVSSAPVYLRNLQMTQRSIIPPASGSDVFANVDQNGAQFQQGLPDSIKSVINQRTYIVDALRYRWPGSQNNQHLTLRYMSGIDQFVKLVSGAMPQPTNATVPPSQAAGETSKVPLLQVAMTQDTLNALKIKVGDVIHLQPDPTDQLINNGATPNDMAVQVTGVIEGLKPHDPYWYADNSLQEPAIVDNGNTTDIYGVALFSPKAYPQLINAISPGLFGYTYRYYVNPAAFKANNAGQLSQDLKRLTSSYGGAFTSRPNQQGVSTGLGDIINQYELQRRLTGSILSLAAIGLFVIALAVTGLIAAFVIERRRDMIGLMRGRGGSAGQLLGTQLVEGLCLALPAGIAGYFLAVVLMHSEPVVWSFYLVIIIVALTAGLLVANLWPLVRRPRNLGTIDREDFKREQFSIRRAVLEVFIVAAAAVGIYLLRRRGLAGDASAATSGAFDPYLAAVPILLGLAVGLVVLRLWVWPVRLLSWNSSYRSDLVPFLGFRRVSRQRLVTSIPLLVLLLAMGIAVFSSIMLTTIDRGQVSTSWARVGADYRIDPISGSQLDPDLSLKGVKGVEATANVYQQSLFATSGGSNSPTLAAVMAVDPASFEQVTKGTPVDPHLPVDQLTMANLRNAGTATNPIPAIVSAESPVSRKLNPGDFFGLQISSQTVTFVVRQVRSSFPAITAGSNATGVGDSPFVVANLAGLEATDPTHQLTRSALYVKAPPSAAGAIQAALDADYSTGILTSRQQLYDQVHDSPLVAGAVSGFRWSIVIAALYSATAVIVALALTGRARARDLGYLRTLGLAPRQVLQLMLLEQVPPVVLALIVGTALGWGVTRLIEPGLNFTAFTGPQIPVGLQTSWWTIIGLALGLIIIVGVSVAIVSFIAERMNLNGVLRIGE